MCGCIEIYGFGRRQLRHNSFAFPITVSPFADVIIPDVVTVIPVAVKVNGSAQMTVDFGEKGDRASYISMHNPSWLEEEHEYESIPDVCESIKKVKDSYTPDNRRETTI